MKEVYTLNQGSLGSLHPNAKEIKYFIDENGCHICVSHRVNKKGYPVKSLNGKATDM